MLDSLVARKNASTLPLLALDDAGFAGWIERQGAGRRAFIEHAGFRPRGGRVIVLPGPAGPALALLGRTEPGPWTWAGAAQRLPAGRYQIEGELSGVDATDAAIGWALAQYGFRRYKQPSRRTKKRVAELVWPRGADRDEVARVVRSVGAARDLINTPAADLGPAELAEATMALGAQHGARVKVLSGARLAKTHPLVHAVGRGSARAPRLIDLTWGSARAPRLTLVGKGVCFDSGGLDLKNAAGMLRMKKDMGGAAIVLALADRVMDARLPVRLRVLIPAVENLPGPLAFRPLDVITSRKGLSVEISNTDAEGRLILADALCDADEEAPDLLIDVATLTGAARLAVGNELTPFFTHDKKLADALARAGRDARDPVWRLPLHRAYRRHLDSRVADLKNAASSQLAGAITAALFLDAFVERAASWVHLDVFGWNEQSLPGRPTGGEPTGLEALWHLVRERYPRGGA